MSDPLDSAIPVGSGSGTTVPPASTPPPPTPPPATSPTPPTSTPSGTDKIWAILSHVSGIIGVPIILPLVIYLAMRNESDYVAANAKEALNFHLSLIICGLACGLLALTVIAIPLVVVIAGAVAIGALVFAIIAAIKAGEGKVYQYPLTIRLVT